MATRKLIRAHAMPLRAHAISTVPKMSHGTSKNENHYHIQIKLFIYSIQVEFVCKENITDKGIKPEKNINTT